MLITLTCRFAAYSTPAMTPPKVPLPVFERTLTAISLACGAMRSEEHTSELQSPCNLVCRLLLEKKKKISERQSLCHIECRLLLRKTNSQTRSHLAKLTDGCVGLSTVLASYLGMRLVPDRALSR